MTKPSHSQSDLERQCHLSGQMSAAQSVEHFGKAAPPAAPPDEWLNEAMRLADDHALWYSQMRDEPHAGRRAKLLAHLATHPSAAPQAVLLLPEQQESDKANPVVAVGKDLPPARAKR